MKRGRARGSQGFSHGFDDDEEDDGVEGDGKGFFGQFDGDADDDGDYHEGGDDDDDDGDFVPADDHLKEPSFEEDAVQTMSRADVVMRLKRRGLNHQRRGIAALRRELLLGCMIFFIRRRCAKHNCDPDWQATEDTKKRQVSFATTHE